MPVIIPTRINQELAKLLATSRFKVVFIMHCNHPNELDQKVNQSIDILTNAGITVFNQSVLLRAVNDNYAALHTLSEKLFSFGVLPYYLHMLDRVAGTTHYEVGSKKAIALHKQLQNSLPGYLVPKLVYEKARAGSKLLLL
jgi:KamA family protein